MIRTQCTEGLFIESGRACGHTVFPPPLSVPKSRYCPKRNQCAAPFGFGHASPRPPPVGPIITIAAGLLTEDLTFLGKNRYSQYRKGIKPTFINGSKHRTYTFPFIALNEKQFNRAFLLKKSLFSTFFLLDLSSCVCFLCLNPPIELILPH